MLNEQSKFRQIIALLSGVFEPLLKYRVQMYWGIGYLWVGLLVFFSEGCIQEQGCTDFTALNYNPDAYNDDGSCVYDLGLPDTYTFSRQRNNSVSHYSETLLQVKINDIYVTILNLGKAGADASKADILDDIYQFGSNNSIQTTIVGNTALQTTYSELNSSVVLRSKVVDTFKADSLLTSYLDTIINNAQNTNKLGTPAVYTLSDGRDLAELIHKTLLCSVLYAGAIQNISSISLADNNTLVNGQYYTSMENQWDRVWGYFGAASNWGAYTIDEITLNGVYAKDNDNDVKIDFGTEYLFYWPIEAALRDKTTDTPYFSSNIFDTFRKGRHAITAKNDTMRVLYKKQLSLYLEELIAANTIHNLNELKKQIQQLGTANENKALVNAYWSAGYAYLSGIRYYSDAAFDKTNDALQIMGTAPTYPVLGSAEYNNYLISIEWIKSQMGIAYNFSATQIENW